MFTRKVKKISYIISFGLFFRVAGVLEILTSSPLLFFHTKRLFYSAIGNGSESTPLSFLILVTFYQYHNHFISTITFYQYHTFSFFKELATFSVAQSILNFDISPRKCKIVEKIMSECFYTIVQKLNIRIKNFSNTYTVSLND